MTGGAWLSSARVVRCWVKVPQQAPCWTIIQLGTLAETAGNKPEEGGDDQIVTCPMTWATRATMAGHNGSQAGDGKLIS